MRNLSILLTCLVLSACSTTYPNKDITGKQFPDVTGFSLEEKVVSIPKDFSASLTLMLVGYKQDSQFDIDRWLIGLDMTQTQIAVYEIPAIEGMFPRMFSTVINNGMRAGIPKQLWKGVITLYKDGETVQRVTGNENPNNARVILIDNTGKTVLFYDKGFSVEALNQLRDTINDKR